MKKLILVIGILVSCSLSAIEVGDFIPACDGSLLGRLSDGREIKTCIEDYGKHDYLLVEFMSIYCGSCIRTLPVVNDLGLRYADKVAAKFVTIDRSYDDVDEFWHKYHKIIDHIVIFDLERVSAKAYKIKYTPTTILVNKSGKVVYKHVGEFTEDEVKALEELLNN